MAALGDLGVRRGIAKLHGLSEARWRAMREADFAPLVSGWAPYSSLGCALMWQSHRVVVLPLGAEVVAAAAAAAAAEGGEKGGSSAPLHPQSKRKLR